METIDNQKLMIANAVINGVKIQGNFGTEYDVCDLFSRSVSMETINELGKYYERLVKKDDGSIFDDETPKSDKNTTVKELLFAVRTIRQAKEKEVQEAEKVRRETEKELIRLEKAQDEAKVAEIKALTSEEIAERIAAAREKLKQ
jgi:hypothetical protein